MRKTARLIQGMICFTQQAVLPDELIVVTSSLHEIP